MVAVAHSTAPGSSGSQPTRAASSRCCVHHHTATPTRKLTGTPAHSPTPKPLRNGPCTTSTTTSTSSHTTHRHTAERVGAFGSAHALWHTLLIARLKLVADASATTRPTTPVVSRSEASSDCVPRTSCTCACAPPVSPKTSRSESTSWSRSDCGQNAAKAKSSGTVVRNACAASRVEASSRLAENSRTVSSVRTGSRCSAFARSASNRPRTRSTRCVQRERTPMPRPS